jgi:hypothetical protein
MSIAEVTDHAPTVTAEPPILERLLRHREGLWWQVRQEADLDRLLWRLLRTSAISLASYGAVLGVAHSAWYLQAVASAIKLPLLYLLTLAICLPTLYLFNLLYGGWLSLRQVIALALAAITVMAGLTVAFAPISVFFLISAHDYGMHKLLNVGILAFTGLTGLGYLVDGMRQMNRNGPDDGAPMLDATTSSIGVPPGRRRHAIGLDAQSVFRRPGIAVHPLSFHSWQLLRRCGHHAATAVAPASITAGARPDGVMTARVRAVNVARSPMPAGILPAAWGVFRRRG